MSKLSLPCIVCSKPLTNTDPETSINQPSGGTEFTSRGHYGSTILDTMCDPDQIEFAVNICDTCILRALDAGVIQGFSEMKGAEIALSRHPVSDEQRAWVLAQNERYYGSAWGKDEPVDYRAEMLKAGWPEDKIEDWEVDDGGAHPVE